jgi:hypothetical protein
VISFSFPQLTGCAHGGFAQQKSKGKFNLRVLSILVQKEILNFEKFAQHRYPGPNSLALHAKNCFNDVQLTAEDQL